MDYSQLSDQEINVLVGKIVSNDGLSIIASNGNAVIHEYADCGEFKGICLGWKVFDPCNNPADAWPIIESERISLLADYEKWGETTAACETDRGGDYIYEYCDKKAFRAAMVVFLQMQDAKHA